MSAWLVSGILWSGREDHKKAKKYLGAAQDVYKKWTEGVSEEIGEAEQLYTQTLFYLAQVPCSMR